MSHDSVTRPTHRPLAQPGGESTARRGGLRVLSVIETLGRGGTETQLLRTAGELVSRGHEWHVAVLLPPYDLQPELEKHGVPVHRLNIRRRWNAIGASMRLA